MSKRKSTHILPTIVLIVCLTQLTTIYCQSLSDGSPLDLITDGVKAMFGLEGVMKTFKKFSEGMIPFPLFVPILPKGRVMELLRGKKHSKSSPQETLEQISESNAKINKLSVPLPLQLQQQLMSKLNPNYNQQLNEQLFFNGLRQQTPELSMQEMPSSWINSGLAGQPGIDDDMRTNNLNLDNDFEHSEDENNYSERFESIAHNSDDYIHTSDDRKTPSAQDVIHNWQIIDEELKKIGQQLGKLGKYLNRN